MRKDPTEFRQRFAAWKNGKQPYKCGLPAYEDGTPDDEFYEDDIAAKKGYDDAKNFIEAYVNSQAFKQRLISNSWHEGFRNSKYDPARNGKYKWVYKPSQLNIKPAPVRGSDGPKYDYETGEVEYLPMNIPLKDNGEIIANSYDEVFSHELGHALDGSIYRYLINNKPNIKFEGKDVWNGYSRSIPILRQNKLYQNIIKQRKPSNESYVDSFMNYSTQHDAFPEENYADLIQMRYLANKYKIFDSLNPNAKFTKEHLKQYKKLKVPTRFLKNFSDDQIIWMMNNVASRNKNTDNEV